MSFFYDLNKKLDSIRATPEVTHQQLNERDMSRAAKGIEKYGKDGMQALAKAGREGKDLDKIRDKYNKYDDKKDVDEGVMDTVKKVGKKVAGGINKLVGHGSDEEMIKDLQRKSGAPVTGKKPEQRSMREAAGPLDFDKVLDAIAALYGDDIWNNDAMQDLAHDLEQAGPTDRELDFIIAKGRLPKRLAGTQFSAGDSVRFGESGAPMTSKQKSFAALAPPKDKITFADKIAGAKKEVDEMLGDVAAEAMRKAVGGGRGRNAAMDEDNAFDYKSPRGMQKGEKKASSTGGEIHQKDEKTVVHTAGRHYGGADEPDPKKEKQSRSGAPVKHEKPRQERVTAKSRKMDRTAHGQAGFKKTNEGDIDPADQGEYDQEGDMAKNDIKTIVRHAQALSKVLGDNDNLPEWVQSKLAKIEGMMISVDEYMQNQSGEDDEEPIAEKAVSKQQQKFMGMAHAMQKGEKIKGASKELKKVAKTMKPKDVEDFAATKHKGLPTKVSKKKKEEEVEESSTTSGAVATSTAAPKSSGGMSFGKGIYDSMNRELENMIAESMSVNMSDSTEGGKSLTITATDEDAMKLAMMLKAAGLGGGNDMHSHGEEPCETCGSMDCGCGDVQEAVDENAPDWPTNTETSDDALQYAGGLNKPKTDVAGDGQTTIPNTAVHTQDEDALRRMMEMAGIKQAELKPWKETMKEEEEDFFHNPNVPKDKQLPAPPKEVDVELDEAEEEVEEDFLESIQRMREIAGIQEAKKDVEEEKTDEGNLFTKGLEDDDVKVGEKIPGTNAIKTKDIDESIFRLTNQWRAYKG